LWSWYFIIETFSREIKSLLQKKAYNVISDLKCTLREDFGDVFSVVYNQVYEELRIEEIDKEKIERKGQAEEEVDEKMEKKERDKEEKIKNGEETEEDKKEPNLLHLILKRLVESNLQRNPIK
jgi:hypothetical protein